MSSSTLLKAVDDDLNYAMTLRSGAVTINAGEIAENG